MHWLFSASRTVLNLRLGTVASVKHTGRGVSKFSDTGQRSTHASGGSLGVGVLPASVTSKRGLSASSSAAL
jgi:hypothetical protein